MSRDANHETARSSDASIGSPVALQVQVDVGVRLDPFSQLPVSLVLLFLICVDVMERIRPCRLIGHCES